MSYKKPYKLYYDRERLRTQRHGNWRQTYVDCMGMCQFPVGEGIVCGELDGLEFHEIFGEVKAGENKFQQRVLLCVYHHNLVHNDVTIVERYYESKLQEDVDFEINQCGSREAWLKKYKLIDREVEYDIEIYSQEHPSDIDYCQDT